MIFFGNYTPLLQVFSAFEKPLLKQTTNTDDRLIYYKAFRYFFVLKHCLKASRN